MFQYAKMAGGFAFFFVNKLCGLLQTRGVQERATEKNKSSLVIFVKKQSSNSRAAALPIHHFVSAISDRRNNFPPLPEKCCVQPCFYQDFAVDIPLEFQRIVKMVYYLWLCKYIFTLKAFCPSRVRSSFLCWRRRGRIPTL